jgi:hypothetical protein
MALRKLPHPEKAAHGSDLQPARGDRLEGRTASIQPPVNFLR